MKQNKIKRRQWVAPNQYIQYLHDYALISLELYRTVFANNEQADFKTFWGEAGYFWLN